MSEIGRYYITRKDVLWLSVCVSMLIFLFIASEYQRAFELERADYILVCAMHLLVGLGLGYIIYLFVCYKFFRADNGANDDDNAYDLSDEQVID